MHIALSPELESYIAQKVASGEYLCPEEVIRDGLRLLREWDEVQRYRLDVLRKWIDVGIQQADRGELIDGDEVFQRLREKIAARAEEHHEPHPVHTPS